MRPDWHQKAACVGGPADAWYSYDADVQRLAKGICEGCPVRDACLDDAMAEEAGLRPGSRHGIRGGLDGWERRRLERERAT